MRSPFIDSFRVMSTMRQKEVIAIGMITAFIMAAAIVVNPAEASNSQNAGNVFDECGFSVGPNNILCSIRSLQIQCIAVCVTDPE